MKYLISSLYLLLLLCALPVSLQANETQFRRDVFKALHKAFASTEPAHSAALLARLADESQIPQHELRPRLIALLDTLKNERKNKSEVWQSLILQGQPEIGAKLAGKLLHYLSKEGRKVLEGEGDFLLDSGVRKAARKSKVPFFQSRTYILRSLDWALSEDLANAEQDPVGLLVGGHSNRFEVGLDPLFIFFDTQDEAFVREQVRAIQRFIIPAMVRRLPESERILWAVRERESNALVVPEFHLVVGVDNFNFTGSNIDLKPCVELTVELKAWENKALLMREPFTFCSEASGSANADDLKPFWNEVADALRERMVAYMER